MVFPVPQNNNIDLHSIISPFRYIWLYSNSKFLIVYLSCRQLKLVLCNLVILMPIMIIVYNEADLIPVFIIYTRYSPFNVGLTKRQFGLSSHVTYDQTENNFLKLRRGMVLGLYRYVFLQVFIEYLFRQRRLASYLCRCNEGRFRQSKAKLLP